MGGSSVVEIVSGGNVFGIPVMGYCLVGTAVSGGIVVGLRK